MNYSTTNITEENQFVLGNVLPQTEYMKIAREIITKRTPGSITQPTDMAMPAYSGQTSGQDISLMADDGAPKSEFEKRVEELVARTKSEVVDNPNQYLQRVLDCRGEEHLQEALVREVMGMVYGRDNDTIYVNWIPLSKILREGQSYRDEQDSDVERIGQGQMSTATLQFSPDRGPRQKRRLPGRSPFRY